MLNLISASGSVSLPAPIPAGHAIAKGRCGDALKDNKYRRSRLIPRCAHTLINMPVRAQ